MKQDEFDCIVNNGKVTNIADTGWICPRCGRSVSPKFSTCPYCNGQANEGINPNEQMIVEG